jgi:hypothetical protein
MTYMFNNVFDKMLLFKELSPFYELVRLSVCVSSPGFQTLTGLITPPIISAGAINLYYSIRLLFFGGKLGVGMPFSLLETRLF